MSRLINEQLRYTALTKNSCQLPSNKAQYNHIGSNFEDKKKSWSKLHKTTNINVSNAEEEN